MCNTLAGLWDDAALLAQPGKGAGCMHDAQCGSESNPTIHATPAAIEAAHEGNVAIEGPDDSTARSADEDVQGVLTTETAAGAVQAHALLLQT